MKKKIFTLIFASTTIIFCNAQKIEIKKVFGGYQYTQNGNLMKMKDLVQTMKSDHQAFELMKKAKSNNAIASFIGFVGGGLIGTPIGAASGGGEANWTLAGVGLGLVAIGIPISSAANKNAKKAIELYNSSLDDTSFYEFKPKFKILSNYNGIGLSMNF